MSEEKPLPQNEAELRTLLADVWKNSIKIQKPDRQVTIKSEDHEVMVTMVAGTMKPLAGIRKEDDLQATMLQTPPTGHLPKPSTGEPPLSGPGALMPTMLVSSPHAPGQPQPGNASSLPTMMASDFARGTKNSVTKTATTTSTRAASATKKAQSTFVAAERLAATSTTKLTVIQKEVLDQAEIKPDMEAPDFEIVRVLGQGGMGVVHIARQTALDRPIALKMIKKNLATDADIQSVFLAEAAVTGDLEHPNIVPIYDLGVTSEGVLFYAMKFAKGAPWINALTTKPLEDNLRILMSVCDAVAFAHSKGIIHRDLKPENVMLGEFGEVLVMDWGLAASVIDNGKIGRLTSSNAAGGTPAYMAPEMATGSVEQIGPRSDVYLLGAILYEIVTGKRPHTGKDMMEVLYNIATNVIQVTDKKGELVDIALKAMRTKPEERYASTLELQTAIKSCMKHFESIAITEKAEEKRERAGESGSYEDFAQALFGYQQALDLWRENRAAEKGAVTTRLAYTRRAMDKQDIDLAESLIEPVKDKYTDVSNEVQRMRREREARKRNLKILTYSSVALLLVLFGGGLYSYIAVVQQRDKAEIATQQAESSRREALDAKDRAEKAKSEAVTEKQRAEAAKEQAQVAEKEAVAQKDKAEKAKAEALAEKQRAEEAEKQAIAEKERTEKAKAEALAAGEKEKKAIEESLKAAQAALKAQDDLARAGVLMDLATKWTFDKEEAQKRQKLAAEKLGKPVELVVKLAGEQKLPLLVVPGGEFVMGSPPAEPNRLAEEFLKRVVITHPYYVATTELTCGQWEAITGEKAPNDTGVPDMPVTKIDVKMVDEILLPKLNKFAPEGFQFRLPTEAEWEFACRAGTNTAFYGVANPDEVPSQAWIRTNSTGAAHPVAKLAPNSFGLYDMHGNVAELCEDMYDPQFYRNSPNNDPVNTNIKEGKFRVVRGGAWANLPQHVRSSYRSYVHPENKYDFMGVRVVLVKTEQVEDKK